MNLRKFLRKQGKVQQNGSGSPQRNGHVQKPPSAQSVSVSPETLDKLIEGRNQLIQRRQQLAQEVQRLDALIQQQEGGIQLMQTLLAGQEEKAAPPAGNGTGQKDEEKVTGD